MKLSWQDCHYMTIMMKREMDGDKWSPDFIIGLSRGGTIPATIFSHMFSVPTRILQASFRDFPGQDDMEVFFSWANTANKNVLVVDDINDTGKTLEYVKNTYNNWIIPGKVRFATLIHNYASNFSVDYYGKMIDKSEHDVWVTFPWEMKIEN